MAITQYTWDPVTDSILEETDGAGNVLASYTNEPTIYGPLISQHSDGDTRYFHFDALGSTRELTDDDENVTDAFNYDAWGNNVFRVGLTATPFQWIARCGYMRSLQQYSVRYRQFHPLVARWSSVDPLFSLFTIQAYCYVNNRPIALRDASGLLPECIAVGGYSESGTTPVIDPKYTIRELNNDEWDVSWRRITWEYEYFLHGGWYGGPGNTVFNAFGTPPEAPSSTWRILAWATAGDRITTTREYYHTTTNVTVDFDTRKIEKIGGATCTWNRSSCRCEISAGAQGGGDENWTTSSWLAWRYSYGVSAFVEARISADLQSATFDLGFASEYGGTVRYSGSYYLDFEYSSSVRRSISNKTAAVVTCEQRG
ncbi:hypothetical protein GC163_24245 [bacterium]|nr:hypothetical protein [bacterium]